MNQIFRDSNSLIRRPGTWIYALLVLLTLMPYWPVTDNQFINFDDNQYVYENDQVINGLSFQNVIWAFSSTVAANWHPMTMLSHMLDVHLYGLNPGGHHFTSLLLHILNTLLLYLLLNRLSSEPWPSLFVAILFAVHPLHVESVAWVAERKDVLSTFFWFLTVLSYLRFLEHKTFINYLMALTFFSLGLMAKPMLVTLPFSLLLMDFWPLGRIGRKTKSVALQADTKTATEKNWNSGFPVYIILEKIPFLIIVAVFCVIVFKVQQIEGAVAPRDIIPLESRLLNALISYCRYLVKTAWPFQLSVFYPFPQVISLWLPVSAGFALFCFSLFALFQSSKRPWLFFGWFWYVGTLVPVIGIIQVGAQSMADRYTYIPLIGIFIAMAWEIAEWVKKHQFRKKFLLPTGSILVAAFSILTWVQVHHWRDSITLYEHVLRINDDNSVIQNTMGLAKLDRNRVQEAIQHFSKAIWLKPDNGKPYNNLGIALVQNNQLALAEQAFRNAIELMPGFADAHVNMGIVKLRQGDTRNAIAHFSQALALNPIHAKAHFSMALAYEKENRVDRAISHYETAIKTEPKLAAMALNRIRQLRKFGE
ncbi:MAG: tetratricopeptide repeat protein [Thermodesulfobacteriota bacterium]